MMPKLPEFEASYGSVEAALMATYGIPAEVQGALRGRVANLQKRGLLGPRAQPGKGHALVYRHDQFSRLLLACELLEFGLNPSPILLIVKSLWERRLRKIFRDAEDVCVRDPGPNDIIMYIQGAHLMVDEWTKGTPGVHSCTLAELPKYITTWMLMDDPAGLPPRALVTNLTMRWRVFHAELGKSYLNEALDERAAKIKADVRSKRRGRK